MPRIFTATDIAQTLIKYRNDTLGVKMRFLKQGLDSLEYIPDHNFSTISNILAKPYHEVDELSKEETALLAGSIRAKLHQIGIPEIETPAWLLRTPLTDITFLTQVDEHYASISIDDSPAALRQLGIMHPAASLGLSDTKTPKAPTELSGDDIRGLLQTLGAKLHAQGLKTTINIVGGAAIALTLANTRSTMDVDAVVVDHPNEFLQASAEVANEAGIDPSWVSDDVSDFVSRQPLGEATLISYPGIDAYVASPAHLLGMKVRAATTRYGAKDNADIALIADHMGLDSPNAIAQVAQRQFQGIYRDSIGFDEYVETARSALAMAALENGDEAKAQLYLEEITPSAKHRQKLAQLGIAPFDDPFESPFEDTSQYPDVEPDYYGAGNYDY